MFSCLLVGAPGCGKSTAASTAPGPVLYIDTDNKLHKMVTMQPLIKSGKVIQWAIDEPLSNLKMTSLVTQAVKPTAKFTQQQPKGYKKIAEVIDMLVENEGHVVIDGKKIKIGTVVLDSYTKMQEHLKRYLTAVNSTIVVCQPLWGTVLLNLEILNDTLVNQIGQFCNVIIICHEKPSKDELTGKVSYFPLVEGSMRDKIAKEFEEVYFMEKTISGGKAKYEMLTVGSTMKPCRTSRLLDSKVEPDFSKIYGGE